ncbi:hypothetical protein GGR56DRAFT_151075 [Xylariaceae sp. FL0804]|nr:hypothetical protein GGR56DRAFT_151075 [Xylariaceae sp. FL0804]
MSFTMKSSTGLLSLVAFASTALGHGFVTSPQARMPGSAMEAACGQQVEINQESDNYGNIQGMLQVANGQSDFDADACNVWLCKGYKFADNKDNVQTFTAGQKLAMTVDIRAPHTGTANVSIVSTATNTVIGDALKSWDVYGSTASSIPADETDFSVTIPSDLGSQCATAGDCVLQWYWNAESIDQTYESCVDFTLSGSGSGSDSDSDSASTASASTASAVASTSTTSQATTAVVAAATSSTSTTSVTTIPAASTSSASTTLVTSTRKSTTTAAAAVATTAATTGTSSSGTVAKYGQCGGKVYTGATTCASGSTCTVMNPYYSQCV